MCRGIVVALLVFPVAVLAQPPSLPDAGALPPAPAAAHTETVDVVAVTPLHGSGLPRLHIPANVQVIAGPDVASGVTDLGALLTRGTSSLLAGDVQGGTFQPDVQFRGFGGSPLLGASEGMAVYIDGMRANEPFGDIVNWDGLPSGAISSVNVMAGSNPLFGLNALGGAVSVRTRDGFGARGTRVAISGGSFDRYRADGEIGGMRDGLAGFVAGSLLDEQGWRDYSPSTLRRGFGKASWRGGRSAVDAAVTVASNDLLGNGTAPERLLQERRSAVFTHPDRTENDLAAASIRFDRFAAPTLRVETMAYLRRARIGTLNGDAADDDDDHDDDEHDAGDDDDDAAEFDAALNRSHTASRSAGAMAQMVWTRPWAGRANQAIIGAGVDAASSGFTFASEYGWLSPTREAIGAGVFDQAAAVALDADTRSASAFLTDTLDLTPRLHVTAAARAHWTTVRLRDRIGVELNGDHWFARVNPSLGVTMDVSASLNLFGSWAQSSRVPTPVELTCADPDDPCRLPNAFVSDPPLDQPVARTWEGGARGAAGRGSWSLALFATRVEDDLIFVSSGRVRGSGHFENVARTNRHGLEAAGEWRAGRITLTGTYTYQQAAYGADLEVQSPFHPAADDGGLPVRAGDSLPGVPAQLGRVGVSARITNGIDVTTTWRAQSSQYLRGDEANLLEPVPAFSVVDAYARWRLGRRLSILAQGSNLFDSAYSTFGMLADASLLGEAYEDEPRFESPGMPRAGWVGVEWRF